VRPPHGVTWADWERVLAARRADTTRSLEQLRHFGPQVAADQVLLTVDEVLRRQAEAHHFWEVRTAHIVTAEGYRYLSGAGAMLVQQLLVVVLLALQDWRTLLLIADGARFVRAFFTHRLAHVVDTTMLLDWYHVHQKCADLCSRICHGRQARAKLLLRL